MHDSLTWYLLPVAGVVSLVWSASRYELPSRILSKAVGMYLKILLGMGLILGVLMLLSRGL